MSPMIGQWTFQMIRTIVLNKQGTVPTLLYAIDLSITRTKRGGNNHFGSTGILKCLTCRKRKGKVYFPLTKICPDKSANIMNLEMLVDFVWIVPSAVVQSCLRRERGRMSCPDS